MVNRRIFFINNRYSEKLYNNVDLFMGNLKWDKNKSAFKFIKVIPSFWVYIEIKLVIVWPGKRCWFKHPDKKNISFLVL